jgi:hypothetical protein
VVAKVAPSGWLRQTTNVAELEKQPLTYELYVFNSEKATEEAFMLISAAPHASEEYGAGGTFRRANVIISTDQGEAGSLTNNAETLLNRCVGKGASQSILRTQTTASTSTKSSSTTPEAEQEPPASESVPSAGQSPAPTREAE